MQAAGTGINLTACTHLLFCELAWVPGLHGQVEDRIHRIGQTKQTSITYLVAKDTIEEHLCRVLQKKQRIVEQALDGKSSKDSLNIYDMLSKKLKRKYKVG